MNDVKSNFLFNVFYRMLRIAIPLVTTPYISRTIGSNGIGNYSYAYSVACYFVMFIMLGLENYGSRTIAQVRDSKEKLSKEFCSIYALQLLLGIGINVIYFGYCMIISQDRAISLLLWLYVLSAMFDINWFLFGLEEFKLIVFRNIVIKLISTISIFFFVKTSKDLLVYCFIMSFSMLISQWAAWPYVLKQINFMKPSNVDVKKHIKPNLFLFITVLFVSIFKTMDKIMLGIMSEMDQVGFYEASEKIIVIPTTFISALGTVMLPRMTNLVSRNLDTNEKILANSIQFAMFVSSSMCFGIMGVSKIFVPFYYGEGFEECISLYLILLPSCLFLAFANVIRTQYLLPHQMDKEYVLSAIIGAIINLVINFLLIPKYKAVGVAIGTLTAEGAVCIYQSHKVKKLIPIRQYIWKSIPFVLAGIVMFLIIYNIDLSFSSTILKLSILILLGVFIYILAMILFYRLFLVLHQKID